MPARTERPHPACFTRQTAGDGGRGDARDHIVVARERRLSIPQP